MKRKSLYYKITKDILILNCILIVFNESLFSFILFLAFLKDAFCETSFIRKYKYIEFEKVKNVEEILQRKLDSIPDYIVKPKDARFACHMNKGSFRLKALQKMPEKISYSFANLYSKLPYDPFLENEIEIENNEIDPEIDPRQIGLKLMEKEHKLF